MIEEMQLILGKMDLVLLLGESWEIRENENAPRKKN
jgi:hypothetical protein